MVTMNTRIFRDPEVNLSQSSASRDFFIAQRDGPLRTIETSLGAASDTNATVSTLAFSVLGRRSELGAAYLEGKFYGLGLINRALSESEKTSVRKYIAQKTGVTLP
jgi:hypothetical protein